jgi:hypothetical protein
MARLLATDPGAFSESRNRPFAPKGLEILAGA